VTEERFILVAVEIECGGDDGRWGHNLPYAPGKLSLGSWHATHGHGAVEAQINAVEGTFGRKAGQHAAHEGLISPGRDPPGAGTGFGPERRLDTDKCDPGVLPSDLDEAPMWDLGAWASSVSPLVGDPGQMKSSSVVSLVMSHGKNATPQCGSALCSRSAPDRKARERAQDPLLLDARVGQIASFGLDPTAIARMSREHDDRGPANPALMLATTPLFEGEPAVPAVWSADLRLTYGGHGRGYHSITSSARASSSGATVRPSILAVLRLITSSALVLCWMGRSAGLVPLRIFPT
jgi:hypothetical protein